MVQNATEGKKDVRRVNVGQGCSNRGLGIVAVTVINWGRLMKGGINYTSITVITGLNHPRKPSGYCSGRCNIFERAIFWAKVYFKCFRT